MSLSYESHISNPVIDALAEEWRSQFVRAYAIQTGQEAGQAHPAVREHLAQVVLQQAGVCQGAMVDAFKNPQ